MDIFAPIWYIIFPTFEAEMIFSKMENQPFLGWLPIISKMLIFVIETFV